jgi:hypothetical protein
VERALLPACLQHHEAGGQECSLHTGKSFLFGPFIIERFSTGDVGICVGVGEKQRSLRSRDGRGARPHMVRWWLKAKS